MLRWLSHNNHKGVTQMMQSSWIDVANIGMHMVDDAKIDEGNAVTRLLKEMVTLNH
jgi:hypothetical protein